jgi:hypothetical protein
VRNKNKKIQKNMMSKRKKKEARKEEQKQEWKMEDRGEEEEKEEEVVEEDVCDGSLVSDLFFLVSSTNERGFSLRSGPFHPEQLFCPQLENGAETQSCPGHRFIPAWSTWAPILVTRCLFSSTLAHNH